MYCNDDDRIKQFGPVANYDYDRQPLGKTETITL